MNVAGEDLNTIIEQKADTISKINDTEPRDVIDKNPNGNELY